MTSQLFWIVFAVFVFGLFVGSNLGIMLMCVLQISGRDEFSSDVLVLSPVEVES